MADICRLGYPMDHNEQLSERYQGRASDINSLAQTCRIYVADDHPLIIESFKSCFIGPPFLTDVTGFLTLALLETALIGPPLPDLVLIDFNMPGVASVNAVAQFIRRHPEVRIAVLSGEINRQLAFELIQCGSLGFVPKTLPPMELYHALKLIISGSRYIPLIFAEEPQFAEPLSRPIPVFSAHRSELTAREVEVLSGLAKGMTNKQIAISLGIVEVTVKIHLRHCFKKLGVRNRVQALRIVLRDNILAGVGVTRS